MPEPTIVFATTCKGRAQHIQVTLPRNLSDNASSPNAKFVVLDYSSLDGLENYLREYHAADIASGRLTVYTHRTPDVFHVSHAKNMAARCAIREGADIMVTLDADNFTSVGLPQFIHNMWRLHADKSFPGIFICPNFPLIHSLPHGPERPARGYAGRLAIKPQDFIKLGGYDETFNTWRGEDVDLIARLQRLDYAIQHFHNSNLHTIPHGADIRFKEYPEAKKYENKQEINVINARTETVVNYGKLGLGTVYRNFDFSNPIELNPIPTRIFGIGMHKTGTTSLHHALEMLGFDSFHWGTGEAPRIWNEMQSQGRSKTLEQHYALSDLPIPLLYRQLDKVYPGSKFILTIRDENDWLESARKLWSYEHNATRWVWDVYPFTNRIHTALYGRPDFDAETCLRRYRQHNEEVIEYFANRYDDLLIMDMDADHKWESICSFLDVPVPTVAYPQKNPTTPVSPPKEWAQACVTFDMPIEDECAIQSDFEAIGKDFEVVGAELIMGGETSEKDGETSEKESAPAVDIFDLETNLVAARVQVRLWKWIAIISMTVMLTILIIILARHS